MQDQRRLACGGFIAAVPEAEQVGMFRQGYQDAS